MFESCRSFFTACLQKLPGKFPRRWGGYFRSDADHRDFTAIGTAAGRACFLVTKVDKLLCLCVQLAFKYRSCEDTFVSCICTLLALFAVEISQIGCRIGSKALMGSLIKVYVLIDFWNGWCRKIIRHGSRQYNGESRWSMDRTHCSELSNE